MRSIFTLLITLFILSIYGCSTNENDPLSPEPEGLTLKLTVTATGVYYIQLENLTAVEINEPLMDETWDISIDNLTNIKLNGGSTAPGAVYALAVSGMRLGGHYGCSGRHVRNGYAAWLLYWRELVFL